MNQVKKIKVHFLIYFCVLQSQPFSSEFQSELQLCYAFDKDFVAKMRLGRFLFQFVSISLNPAIIFGRLSQKLQTFLFDEILFRLA